MSTFTVAGERGYHIDGHPVRSVTEIIKAGLPAPALIGWAGKATAAYAVDHWDELAALGPSERFEILRTARNKVRDESAVRGTDLHRILQYVVSGAAVDIPEHLHRPAQALRGWVDAWDAQPVLVETPVASITHHYAGRLDLVADLNDGHRWLLDLKSGSGIYADHVVQLAGYRGAEVHLDADGNQHPMPRVDRVGCIHLTVDDATLKPVDCGREAWTAFLAAQRVAAWAWACDARWRQGWPVHAAVHPPVRAATPSEQPAEGAA